MDRSGKRGEHDGKASDMSDDERLYRISAEHSRDERIESFTNMLFADSDDQGKEIAAEFDDSTGVAAESKREDDASGDVEMFSELFRMIGADEKDCTRLAERLLERKQFKNSEKSKVRKVGVRKRNADSGNIHAGHRARMRESAHRDAELKSFSDVEILELVLSYAIPRRDTNPIAHRLLDKFGTVYSVFRAAKSDLKKISGMTNAACEILSMITELIQTASKPELCISTRGAAAEFFASVLVGEQSDKITAAFLDSDFMILGVERSDAHGLELTRSIVGSACKYSARYVIIGRRGAGVPQRSTTDKELESLRSTLALVNVVLADCLLFTDFGYYAFGTAEDPDVDCWFYPYRSVQASSDILAEVLGGRSRAGNNDDER